jgi:hypothetical protein
MGKTENSPVDTDHVMADSRVIEVNGVFLGAAVALPHQAGWKFVAANDRVGPLNGRIASSLSEARLMARGAFYSAA